MVFVFIHPMMPAAAQDALHFVAPANLEIARGAFPGPARSGYDQKASFTVRLNKGVKAQRSNRGSLR